VLILIVGHLVGMPFLRGLRVVGASMPLLFCFVAFYHEARFAFFDLFVKRALTLFTTLLLLALWISLVFPLLDGFELGGMQPLVLAFLLMPPVAALPWLYRRLGHILDNLWLGRRYTTVEAVKTFLSGLHDATEERELVAQAERGLSTIFHAPVRIDLELRQVPPVEFLCVRDVPLRSGGRTHGVILLGQRTNQTPYFSEDLDLLDSLAEVFSYMLENVRLQARKQEQEQRARELSLQASRSELKALRAQINPHFLFNALNAIAGLIHKDPFRADATVEQLAEVFRYTLKSSQKEWARLEEEMEFVQAYLEVEQARFGDRLTVEIDIDPAVRRVPVPTMVVQTLVENAVKHGVGAVRGPARIEVRARPEEGRLVVEVGDNGPGFPEPAAASGGMASYGLRNIRERFRGYFGGRARLDALRDEELGVTVVRIAVPLDHAKGDKEPGGSAGVA
jgi:signal transduction histidine kinase